MQLTYRGNKYELTTAASSTVSGDLIVKYRGATFRTQRYLVAPPQSLNLVYRSVSYESVTNRFKLAGLFNAI